MLITTIVLSIIVVVLAIIVAFLGTEMLKKFKFIDNYYSYAVEHRQVFAYRGCKYYEKPAMRELFIRSKSGKQFTVLIGLRFKMFGINGFDPFGCVTSNYDGTAGISIFLGKGPAEFLFLSTQDDIEVSLVSDGETRHQPVTVYKPHWFQRLGIFG